MGSHRAIPLLALLGLLFSLLPLSATTAPATGQFAGLSKIELLVLEELDAEGRTDFFAWLEEKPDLSPAYQLQTKEEKGCFVYETLRETAERAQAPLRAYLDAQGVEYRAFYIANKILVRGGDQALLLAIAGRPDVAQITANHHGQLDLGEFRPSLGQGRAVEPNISFVRADQAWALGITGEGAVLAGNDTGMDETHPALARHYRGCLNPPTCSSWDHNYNWWDAIGEYPTEPGDENGHGTHTTGTMVGDDGWGNQIGLAPGAQTIHCKNMGDSGGWSEAAFLECFEWDLAPWDLNRLNPRPDLAPDAINNSWGYGNPNLVFKEEIQALHAAGIVVEAIAGNEGPACQTLRSPGMYWEVLTVGAVNHASPYPGTLSGFSSRGPSEIDPTPPYWFPEVMAPGENVRSSYLGGGYAYGQGTSMAGPHATALVALCWSVAPSLRGQVYTTIDLINSTATPLTGQGGSNCGGDYVNGPNNDWGYGTIDALALVRACAAAGGADFDLTLTPDRRDACRPALVTANLTVDPIGLYKQPVTLSDSGVPAGVDTSFSVNPVFPLPGNSTYIVDVTAGAADGTYSWLISGTSPTLTLAVPFTLTINGIAPPSPSLKTPVDGAQDVRRREALFAWNTVPQASSYHLQVDDDPTFVSPEADVSGIEANTYLLPGPLAAAATYYWRVGTTNACGEGDFAAAFSFTTQLPCLLLVDDDNNAPDVRPYYETALTSLGYSYDVFDVGGGVGDGPTLAEMQPYRGIIWFSGDKWGDSAGPNATDEVNLAAYLDGGSTCGSFASAGTAACFSGAETGGGHLFLSSQAYLYDFGLTTFGEHYLGIESYIPGAGDADTKLGQAGDPIGDGLGPYPLTYLPNFVDHGDLVNPAPEASLAFRSSGGNPLDIDKDGGAWRTVFFGTSWVPIYVNNPANGEELLARIVGWFGNCCEPVTDTLLTWTPLTPTAGQVVTFTASASGTEPISYSWKFEIGDSNLELGNPITHVYTMAGAYTVMLTATNGCGAEVVRDVITVVVAPLEEWAVCLPIIHK
jgi:subtilisin family serine protease/PKD repeat protein